MVSEKQCEFEPSKTPGMSEAWIIGLVLICCFHLFLSWKFTRHLIHSEEWWKNGITLGVLSYIFFSNLALAAFFWTIIIEPIGQSHSSGFFNMSFCQFMYFLMPAASMALYLSLLEILVLRLTLAFEGTCLAVSEKTIRLFHLSVIVIAVCGTAGYIINGVLSVCKVTYKSSLLADLRISERTYYSCQPKQHVGWIITALMTIGMPLMCGLTAVLIWMFVARLRLLVHHSGMDYYDETDIYGVQNHHPNESVNKIDTNNNSNKSNEVISGNITINGAHPPPIDTNHLAVVSDQTNHSNSNSMDVTHNVDIIIEDEIDAEYDLVVEKSSMIGAASVVSTLLVMIFTSITQNGLLLNLDFLLNLIFLYSMFSWGDQWYQFIFGHCAQYIRNRYGNPHTKQFPSPMDIVSNQSKSSLPNSPRFILTSSHSKSKS